MPYDGSVVFSIVNELRQKILNGKVDKVYQTEKDELILNIRTYGETHKLLLSSSPVYPRVHLTRENKTNPQTPPAFCMLLRKHLTGGRIIDIKQPNYERIVEIEFECIDELGYSNKKSVIAEIMGRHSNIIFIDKESNKVIDSIKRISFEVSSVREILPGKTYELPPAGERKSPIEEGRENFIGSLNDTSIRIKPDKYLMKTYNGISPASARELCQLSGIDQDSDVMDLPADKRQDFWHSFSSFFTHLKDGSFKPNMVLNNGSPLDFYCLELKQYASFDIKYFDTMSIACESFYGEKDKKDRLKQKTGDLNRIINGRLDRCFKKLEILQNELADANSSEKYKIYGDLITSNLHAMEKGASSVKLMNYYSEAYEELEIPLDNMLTPVQNAQRYYKHYNKAKTAQTLIQSQLEDNKDEILYLETQLDNLDKCSDETEINEIRIELAEQGYIRSKVAKASKHVKPSKPMHFVSSDGIDIYVGKNNVQNDFLTLKFSSSNDTWLHTKNIPGSHVIIKNGGAPFPTATLDEAANLAAYYSKGKSSANVPIDYTQRKNVKKPSGAKPGMVIYETYKTVYITPDEEKINHMKKS